jgi:hypothetical protein
MSIQGAKELWAEYNGGLAIGPIWWSGNEKQRTPPTKLAIPIPNSFQTN